MTEWMDFQSTFIYAQIGCIEKLSLAGSQRNVERHFLLCPLSLLINKNLYKRFSLTITSF